MKSFNRKCFRVACLLAVAAAFSSCGKDAVNGGDVVINESAQTITLAVANTGDNFLATRSTARNLYSSAAAQNIEKVKVVIYRIGDLPLGVTDYSELSEDQVGALESPYGLKTIVAQKLFSDWMNNGVSSAYNNTTSGHGRQASWTLSKNDQIVREGVYMAYAVGYNDSEYAAYTDFAALAKDGTFTFPLSVAQNSSTEVAPKVYEVFAGSAPFVVTKKEVSAGSGTYSYQFNVSLTLHRQVAGTIGYFTNIPLKGNADHKEKTGDKLRLVASSRSASAAFAAFNSEYTGAPGATTTNVDYVVNGYGVATKATADEAKFYGSTTSDAYTVYEVKLSDWFKGYSDAGTTLGMDINGDGMLNEGDVEYNETATWVNPLDASNTTPGVKKGTVLGSSFLFPFVMDSSKPTFQLQMLDASGDIIRYWNIRLQTTSSTDSQIGEYVNVVNASGVVTSNTEQENYVNYSILRNHLYSIGSRNAGDGGTDPDSDDKAQPLNNETVIVRVNDNWEMIHEMEID